jgi:hypothetical protein
MAIIVITQQQVKAIEQIPYYPPLKGDQIQKEIHRQNEINVWHNFTGTSQQEQIDKLTEQAKKLNQEIKNTPNWMIVRAGQAFALYDGIKKGFPNGLPQGCNVVQDDNNDAEHSHTYTIKCIAS